MNEKFILKSALLINGPFFFSFETLRIWVEATFFLHLRHTNQRANFASFFSISRRLSTVLAQIHKLFF